MVNSEWFDFSGDPGVLLNTVRGLVSERKLRLFACACCRRIWPLLTDERSRAAVRIAEDFADGHISLGKLEQAHSAAAAASIAAAAGGIFTPAEHSAVAACYCVSRPGIICFAAANRAASSLIERKDEEQEAQCLIFRDLMGNPFRTASLPRMGLNRPSVRALAQTINDNRSFEHMSQLADELEQAGFADKEVLDHCRGPGPHVRGCWVIDLILGLK